MASRAISRRRKIGIYTFIAMYLVWMITAITIQMVQASVSGVGTGFGDGHLKPSIHTPGGPYYPQDWKGPR